MGAYENPSMIVDKSGQILAQGFQSAAQSIAKGIDTYSQRYNKALEEQRKRVEQRKKQDSQANIRASQGSLNFMKQAKAFNIKDQTSLTSDFMQNVYLPKVQELGDAYYNYGKTAFNLNSTEEQIAEATRGMLEIENNLKSIQNKASGGELILDSAKAIVDERDKYGVLAFGDMTYDQSNDLLTAISTGKNKGVVGNTIFEVNKNEDNNDVYTFKNPENDQVVFQQEVDTSDPDWIDNITVEKLNVADEFANYAEEQEIKVGNKLSPSFIKNTEFVVENGVKYEVTNYNTQELVNKFSTLKRELTKKLTSFDANNPTNQSRVIKAFLQDDVGYTDEEVESIFNPKEGDQTTEEQISGAVEKYILNKATGGSYLLNENGDIYSKISKGEVKETKIPKWKVQLDAASDVLTDIKGFAADPMRGGNFSAIVDFANAAVEGDPFTSGYDMIVKNLKAAGEPTDPEAVKAAQDQYQIKLDAIYKDGDNTKPFSLEGKDKIYQTLLDVYNIDPQRLKEIENYMQTRSQRVPLPGTSN